MRQVPDLRTVLLLAALAAVLAIVPGCERGAPEAESPTAQAAQVGPEAAADCTADPAWVSSPSLPAEVANGAEATNCNFHQFEWQSFLYLISDPSTGKIGGAGDPTVFGSYMSTDGIFVAAGEQPVPWGEPVPPPPTCDAEGGELILSQAERISGTATIDGQDVDEAILEAGSGAPLVAQARNGVDAQWAHFGIAVNEPMYDYLTSCELYKTQCFDAVAKQIDFPPGAESGNSIELKTAWKVVASPEAAPNYYTTTALVVPSGPPASAETCEKVTAALVGFHLVHKTPLHPEWIWATFEHLDNAPDCTDPAPPPPGGWSFNDPSCTDCKLNAYVDPCTQTGEFDPDCAKPAAPTQVCREHPWGGGSEENQDNIQAINASVATLLGDSVWANYHLTAGIWFDISKPDKPQAGSLLAANTTAETYLQSINCFACHTAAPQTKAGEQEADFSHTFSALKGGGACSDDLPAYCPSSG
jgi:hypothetical protein